MMDFNATASLSGQVTALIDIGMQRARAAQPRRAYLGASRLGAACERALQYEVADAPVDPGRETEGRMLRIFERGHVIEDCMARWLEERCVREPNAKSLTAELFADWKHWAEAAGEFAGSQKRFADLLLTRGVEKWRNTAGVRGFRGIGLKHPPKPAYTPYADD